MPKERLYVVEIDERVIIGTAEQPELVIPERHGGRIERLFISSLHIESPLTLGLIRERLGNQQEVTFGMAVEAVEAIMDITIPKEFSLATPNEMKKPRS